MKVLMIAPACDGEDVGRGVGRLPVGKLAVGAPRPHLLTTYKRGHTPPARQLSGVRVIEWEEPAGVGRFERLNSLMQPGYVPFYIRARRWIRQRLAVGERFDIAHQVVPVAMRYPSPRRGPRHPPGCRPSRGQPRSRPRLRRRRRGRRPGGRSCAGSTRGGSRTTLCSGGRTSRRRASSASPRTCRSSWRPCTSAGFEIMSETAVHEVYEPIDRTGRNGPVRLLYVGRIIRTKGLRDVIRALDLVRDLDVTLDVRGRRQRPRSVRAARDRSSA